MFEFSNNKTYLGTDQGQGHLNWASTIWTSLLRILMVEALISLDVIGSVCLKITNFIELQNMLYVMLYPVRTLTEYVRP